MGDEIARKGAFGEGGGSWNTRRMNTMEVESVTPVSNGGEPLAALQGLPPAKASLVCAEEYVAECTLRVSDLIEQCQKEIQAYRRGEASTEAYGLELLRRAFLQGDQAAWAGVQQCFGEPVRGWLHGHPRREAAFQLESEETYVALTFERFWQANIQQQVRYRSLGGALLILRASLRGTILDTLRTYSRPREVARPMSGELPLEDQAAIFEVRKLLRRILSSDRERRLAYLLFHCGLSPKDIVIFLPQEFQDVREISRLRCFIVERLLHQMDHFPGWPETVEETSNAVRSVEERDGEGGEYTLSGKT